MADAALNENGERTVIRKSVVYLCTPYARYVFGKDQAAKEAALYAAALSTLGYIVFSPVTHSHPISAHLGNSDSHDFWMAYDRPFLEMADEVHVMTMLGYEKSLGISIELGWARDLGKVVVYHSPYKLVQRATELRKRLALEVENERNNAGS